jgi:hypothetical protein
MKETHALKGPVVKKWLDVHMAARKLYTDAGFPQVRGTPVGALLDIPEIVKEASGIADRVRDRKARDPKKATVEWFLHLKGDDAIIVDVYVRG